MLSGDESVVRTPQVARKYVLVSAGGAEDATHTFVPKCSADGLLRLMGFASCGWGCRCAEPMERQARGERSAPGH